MAHIEYAQIIDESMMIGSEKIPFPLFSSENMVALFHPHHCLPVIIYRKYFPCDTSGAVQ
jgi:hypothetical protein